MIVRAWYEIKSKSPLALRILKSKKPEPAGSPVIVAVPVLGLEVVVPSIGGIPVKEPTLAAGNQE